MLRRLMKNKSCHTGHRLPWLTTPSIWTSTLSIAASSAGRPYEENSSLYERWVERDEQNSRE